jgi:hypothetical protein
MKVLNLSRVKLNLDLKSEEVLSHLKVEIEQTGRQIQYKAKQAAESSLDMGTLKQSIFYEPTNNGLGAKITANAMSGDGDNRVNYAPFIEFGTGGLVNIPKGYEKTAAQFKGKGIRQINLPARPFLIPTTKSELRKMIKRLKAKYGTK